MLKVNSVHLDYFESRRQLLSEILLSSEPIIPIAEFFENKEVVKMFGRNVKNPMLRNSSTNRGNNQNNEEDNEFCEKQMKKVKMNPPETEKIEQIHVFSKVKCDVDERKKKNVELVGKDKPKKQKEPEGLAISNLSSPNQDSRFDGNYFLRSNDSNSKEIDFSSPARQRFFQNKLRNGKMGEKDNEIKKPGEKVHLDQVLEKATKNKDQNKKENQHLYSKINMQELDTNISKEIIRQKLLDAVFSMFIEEK